MVRPRGGKSVKRTVPMVPRAVSFAKGILPKKMDHQHASGQSAEPLALTWLGLSSLPPGSAVCDMFHRDMASIDILYRNDHLAILHSRAKCDGVQFISTSYGVHGLVLSHAIPIPPLPVCTQLFAPVPSGQPNTFTAGFTCS